MLPCGLRIASEEKKTTWQTLMVKKTGVQEDRAATK